MLARDIAIEYSITDLSFFLKKACSFEVSLPHSLVASALGSKHQPPEEAAPPDPRDSISSAHPELPFLTQTFVKRFPIFTTIFRALQESMGGLILRQSTPYKTGLPVAATRHLKSFPS